MIVNFARTADGGFSAHQQQRDPAVYLDLCGLRAIAEDPQLGSRFIAAMIGAGASLLISSLTIYEFSILSDLRHAQAVDALLRQLFRHLYFIHHEPFTVIAREDAQHSAPHADAEFFKQTLAFVIQKEGSVELTTIMSEESARLRPTLQQLGSGVSSAFETLKKRIDSEPELRRNADRALKLVGNRNAATKALMTALIKPMHDDQLPDENDIIDFLHAVVPCAYADLVVLDGKWASAVAQAAQRIRRAGYKAPIARTFSMRKNGIAEFLAVLEARASTSKSGDSRK